MNSIARTQSRRKHRPRNVYELEQKRRRQNLFFYPRHPRSRNIFDSPIQRRFSGQKRFFSDVRLFSINSLQPGNPDSVRFSIFPFRRSRLDTPLHAYERLALSSARGGLTLSVLFLLFGPLHPVAYGRVRSPTVGKFGASSSDYQSDFKYSTRSRLSSGVRPRPKREL